MNSLRTALTLAWLAVLLFPWASRAETLVDLTAEIEATEWSYQFFADGLTNGSVPAASLFAGSQTVHCMVGTNCWFMECGQGWFYNGRAQYWFTGTNVIRYYELTRSYTNEQGQVFRAGETSVESTPSRDGNPGRPVKVVDVLALAQQIPWLAFCSGSALKTPGRQLNPPLDLWKETTDAPQGFTDLTKVYPDALGLPMSIKLFAQTSQPIFQYQVHATTNVLGWHFPREFYMVQYEPDGTGGWVASFTARGRITAIGSGQRPAIPEPVLRALKNQRE